MRYYGQFASINNKIYNVEIITDNDRSSLTELLFADDAVIVSTKNSDSGIFTPIRLKEATIRLVIAEPFYDLYSSTSTGTSVKITEGTNTIFFGYIAPNIYTLPYEKILDSIELQAVESPSILQYIDYPKDDNSGATNAKFHEIVSYLMGLCSIDYYYICDSFNSDYWIDFKINERNFFDNDEEETPWKCSQVLEEICKYFGCTFEVINGEGHFIDTALVHKGSYTVLKCRTGYASYTTETKRAISRQLSGFSQNGTTIELDDTYDEIRITANSYPIDNVFDLDPFVYNNYLRRVVEKEEEDGEITRYNYKISFPNDKWMMYQYHYMPFTSATYTTVGNWGLNIGSMPTLWSELIDPSELSKEDSMHRKYDLFSSIEAHCVERTGDVTYNWLDYLTLSYMVPDFVIGGSDSYYSFNRTDSMALNGNKNKALMFNDSLNYPIMRLNPDIEDMEFTYSPISATGTTWLLFTGNVYFSETRDIMPSEDTADPSIIATLEENLGFDFLPIELKIGNKYWNGTLWTTTLSKFNLRVGDKLVSVNGFNSFYNNVDISSGLNTKGYAIPIKMRDNVKGKMSIVIYSPKMPVVRLTNLEGENFKWGNYPVLKRAYIKDFAITLHTQKNPQSVWDEEEYSDEDTEYFNIINSDNVNTFNKIQLKINTLDPDKSLSLSSVLDEGNEYIEYISSRVDNRIDIMENHIIEKYYNHYSTPKKILNIHVKDYLDPYITYNWRDFNRLVVNGYNWSLKYENNEVKLIEL